jgi:hypothetical protein
VKPLELLTIKDTPINFLKIILLLIVLNLFYSGSRAKGWRNYTRSLQATSQALG